MKYQQIKLKNRGYGKQIPLLSAYIQDTISVDSQFQRPAVIICPGGGYEFTTNREGEPIALAFLEKGYQAFVLDYTIIDNDETQELLSYPFYDLAYAIYHVRKHYKEYTIDPNQISIIGFSAGGHLCATYSHMYAQEWFIQKMGYTKEEIKPNHMILCYPVIDMTLGWPKTIEQTHKITKHPESYKAQYLVSQDTPPTFIWHTVSDNGVPITNTMAFVQALIEHHIDHEVHTFHLGNHGLSLATSQSAKRLTEDYINPHVAKWFDIMIDWLNDQHQ